MIFEIVSGSFFAGILGTVLYHQNGGGNDHKKIENICASCGLYKKDDKGNKKYIRIHRRSKIEGGMEYIYQIPHGMSFKDFQAKFDHIQDGLNIKKSIPDFSIQDFKQLKFDKTIIKQIQKLADKKRTLHKEVELVWDGMLKIKVYDEPLTTYFELTDELLDKCKGWQIPLGMTRHGFIKHDMEHGHIVVAGITRYGKTVFLKMLITSLIHRKPQEVKFSLLDLKGGLAFGRFKDCKQVANLAFDIDSSHDVLEKVSEEMKARWNEFRRKGFEDIGEAKIKERHIVIVDEGAELASQGFTGEDKQKRQQCERYLSEIARLGAGLGIRIVYCTQYPTADILPRQVKQNAPTKISFRLTNQTASEVVLDQSGAEKLPKGLRGRALVLSDSLEEVQCPFIANDFIQKKITPHINIRSGKPDESKDILPEGREDRQHLTLTKIP
jgi:hypothetical protein